MKIPRKADLINLQEIYKSDAKIAEALGGIPEYLIAYWRRKKGVAPHSAPKFTKQQIADVWERHGDDFRCGRELNISKAAFYSWRRKYGILERPAFLKLEQLELLLNRSETGAPSAHLVVEPAQPRTAVDKIRDHCRDRWPGASHAADCHIAAQAGRSDSPVVVSPGPSVRWPTTPPVAGTELPDGPGHDPVWCLPDRGSIVWQLVEARTILPGSLVVGPQRIVSGLGGLGILASDPEGASGPGRPIKIEITRRLHAACDVEDIVLAILYHGWRLDEPGVTVEFSGMPIERLTVDRKVRLCRLTVANGALAAICPFDDAIRRHYGRLLLGRYPQTHADRSAVYHGEHFLEGRGVQPRFGSVDETGCLHVLPQSDPDIRGVVIGPEAYPYEIELAASLIEGHVIPGAMAGALLVCPATIGVYRLAQRRGWLQTLINAGASVLDVGLARRLGWNGIVRLAAGDQADSQRAVCCTNLPSEPPTPSAGRLVFASVRSALSHSGLIPRTDQSVSLLTE
ncbi:MAG: hypothetical protein AB1792_06875 [Candidatus Zixiibacteriota bacterium]